MLTPKTKKAELNFELGKVFATFCEKVHIYCVIRDIIMVAEKLHGG